MEPSEYDEIDGWDMRQKMSARVAMLWRAQGNEFLEHYHHDIEADVERLRATLSEAPPQPRPRQVIENLTARARPAASTFPSDEAVIDLTDDADAIVVIPDQPIADAGMAQATARFAAAGGQVRHKLASCHKHSFEHATDNCRRCRTAFCSDCLVYVGEARRPYCMDCALVAAGIRPPTRHARR